MQLSCHDVAVQPVELQDSIKFEKLYNRFAKISESALMTYSCSHIIPVATSSFTSIFGQKISPPPALKMLYKEKTVIHSFMTIKYGLKR